MIFNSKVQASLVSLIFLLFVNGCSSDKNEEQFTKKAYKLFDNKTHETTFKDFVDFTWSRVCFGYGPDVELTFFDESKDIEVHMELPDKFYIQEDYVKESPSKKCFINNQVFILHYEIATNKEMLIKYKEMEVK